MVAARSALPGMMWWRTRDAQRIKRSLAIVNLIGYKRI